MILGDTRTEPVQATTLDDLFRRTAARRPDAIALADPPDRESFTDGPPRRLTYAETDRIVSAIATVSAASRAVSSHRHGAHATFRCPSRA